MENGRYNLSAVDRSRATPSLIFQTHDLCSSPPIARCSSNGSFPLFTCFLSASISLEILQSHFTLQFPLSMFHIQETCPDSIDFAPKLPDQSSEFLCFRRWQWQWRWGWRWWWRFCRGRGSAFDKFFAWFAGNSSYDRCGPYKLKFEFSNLLWKTSSPFGAKEKWGEVERDMIYILSFVSELWKKWGEVVFFYRLLLCSLWR